VSISSAKRLLDLAGKESDRLSRHLLVAAALREALPGDIVVVGGVAEDYWGQDRYAPTDVDLTGSADPIVLKTLGFRRADSLRHWRHLGSDVVVEFPVVGGLAGDRDRVVGVQVAGGEALMIAVEDIYLDRLEQSTAVERGWKESESFIGALRIAERRAEEIDWAYVARRIDESGARLRPMLLERQRAIQRTLKRAVVMQVRERQG
jgi:hypothetical protein